MLTVHQSIEANQSFRLGLKAVLVTVEIECACTDVIDRGPNLRSVSRLQAFQDSL